jgi:hypothetical protein
MILVMEYNLKGLETRPTAQAIQFSALHSINHFAYCTCNFRQYIYLVLHQFVPLRTNLSIGEATVIRIMPFEAK